MSILSPRFEALIGNLTPELREIVEPRKADGETLVKLTYIVEQFDGLVYFPADVVLTLVPATEEKPEYLYGKVGGAHIHYLEGATAKMVEDGAVHIQLRIRTCEPLMGREGATRNYEVVLRITPIGEGDVATKQLWLEPAVNFYKTVVNPRHGVLIHKGADLLIQDYDAKEAMIAEQIAAAAQ